MNIKIFNELDRLITANPRLIFDKNQFLQVINGTFAIELESIPSTDLAELEHIIDSTVLVNYFGKIWQPATKKYKYSGLSIIDEVNAMNPAAVIDVGCGYNEFRGKIQNLIGIDPYNERADIMTRIEEFESETEYDVAICLGSINFGSSEKIIREMTKVVSIVKPGGKLYFRVNPGEQHAAPESQWINFYNWNPVFISNVAMSLGCTVEKMRQDVGNRLYFVLHKDK